MCAQRSRYRSADVRTVVLSLLSLLPACGGPAVFPVDVLIVAQLAEPKSLDPQVTTSLNDFRILVNLYEGLVRFRDGTLEPEPALARAWDVSEDGRVYTVYLRRGVRFHDGTSFDAEAVRFNFERMLNDDHPYHHTGPFPLAFLFETVERIEVVDTHTVRLHLAQPFAPLLANLAYPTGLMISPAAVRRYGKDYGRHPVGTGQFRFVDWDPGRRVMLERNHDYHGPPALPCRLVFRPITDPMTRVAELMAGGVDLVSELAPEQLALLRADSAYRVLEQTGPHLWFLIFNTREGPFTDRRVRLAASHAIDRRALVDQVLQGTAELAVGPIPSAFAWASDAGLSSHAHDRRQARELLAQAGYANGLDVTFLVPQGGSGMLAPVQMATAIQADLAEVGIRARIETYEWNAYLAKVNRGLAGQGDLAEMAWMTNDPDTLPYLALHSKAMPEHGGFNSGYYSDKGVDRLIERARRTVNQSERAALYRELAVRVHHDVPWAVIASWRQNVVTRAGVHGLRLQPSFFLLLQTTRKNYGRESACR